MTHTLHVSGWNWDEAWRVWEATLPTPLNLQIACLHGRGNQRFWTCHPHCPSELLPVCLPNYKLVPLDHAREQFWDSIQKTEKKEAQFWVLCKCHKTPVTKLHTVWFSRPKWQIPDHITGGVIEAIKQSPRDTDYQRVLLSAAIKGIKYICNKQEQQKQKDQWHQLIPNNLQEKQMPWTGRKRSLSTHNRYINLKNPRWCSHWEKQMHRAGKVAG